MQSRHLLADFAPGQDRPGVFSDIVREEWKLYIVLVLERNCIIHSRALTVRTFRRPFKFSQLGSAGLPGDTLIRSRMEIRLLWIKDFYSLPGVSIPTQPYRFNIQHQFGKGYNLCWCSKQSHVIAHNSQGSYHISSLKYHILTSFVAKIILATEAGMSRLFFLGWLTPTLCMIYFSIF